MPTMTMKTYRIQQCGCRALLALALLGGSRPANAQVQAAAVHEAVGLSEAALRALAGTRAWPEPAFPPANIADRAGSAPSACRDLLGHTGGDIRRLPSRETAALLTVGAIAAAGVRPADQSVSRSLSGAAHLEEPLEPGAVLGSTPFQMAGSLATYGFARWAGNRRLAIVGADLFRSQLVAEGLTIGLKQAIRRRRPEGGGFAFPSGHTTVSFASATVLQRHYGWRLGAPAYGIATYVALSRVQMKRHYLSDVAFGAALGIVAGRSVTIGSLRRMRLEPLVVPGGGGVQFSWNGR